MQSEIPQPPMRMAAPHRLDGSQTVKPTVPEPEKPADDADFGLAWLGTNTPSPEGQTPVTMEYAPRTAPPHWANAATVEHSNARPQGDSPAVFGQMTPESGDQVTQLTASAPTAGAHSKNENVPTAEFAAVHKSQLPEKTAAPAVPPPATETATTGARPDANPNAALISQGASPQAASAQDRTLRSGAQNLTPHSASSEELRGNSTPKPEPSARQVTPAVALPQTTAVPAPPEKTSLPGDFEVHDAALEDIEFRHLDNAKSDQIRTEAPKLDTVRSEMGRHASTQIVDAVRQGRDGVIEVSLSPEELGRVKLTLTGNDGQMHVFVQSDRPETQELLRRHIAQLQQDFRDLGYADVSFDFGNSEQRSGQFAENSPEASDSYAETHPNSETKNPASSDASRSRTLATANLDLRL
ncbi:flagellar hook-length control protein FliK [Meridianimarinicoccus aquatilis]|uniref:Flagellar hook-length control protein FliK n=1 Tax=Meridianimarinicoccus aquatilis TaxID=2552766 RepID=A0A4R6ALP6_9RHOB|nr:flagellar hook-length control protein FliK [Fluviibacterium aquatile]TDL84930.1 flagellar hook-length control protein FliK [Fluviibacterium aquatile]TDL87018.1 flagellar hook-length control protein FliK [Fluviibacterium aquatile]